MSAPLEQQAKKALAVVNAAPVGVFVPSAARMARWNVGVSLLAQALAVFAEVAVGGDEDALADEGLLGDAALVIQAREAADGLRGALGQLAGFEGRSFMESTWPDMASGAYSGEDGQRRLVAIAAKLAERFPARPEVTR